MIRESENLTAAGPLRALILARAKVNSEDIERLASELDSETESDVEIDLDEQIADLYRQLRVLANEPPSAMRDKQWQIVASQLRMLEEAEARQMEEHANTHGPLPPGSGDAAIRRADELLRKYGNPTIPHRSVTDSD